MTPKDQARFIRELGEAVVEKMAKEAEAGQLPPDWNGHEMRRWMTLRFKRQETTMSKAAVREFNNTIAISNL